MRDLPVPMGGSLSLPLGLDVTALARLWRVTRAEEIARRLVVLSAAHAAFFRPLPKRGPAFSHVVAFALEEYLEVLLRAVTRGAEADAARRLESVYGVWGDDPRVRHHVERWRRASAYGARSFAATLERVAAAMAPARAPERDVTEEERGCLAATDALIASIPARRRAFALLRDVYAHPDDVGRRLVLSDALSELGDPWGELIALQCAPPEVRTESQRAREASLLAAGRDVWLGRLAPYVLDRPSVVFENGFPAVLAASKNPRSAGLYEWATVRRGSPWKGKRAR